MTITTYAQLNVGRNIGIEPMDSALWLAFIQSASHALAHAAGEHRLADTERWTARLNDVQVHHGKGEWDGVAEDSAHISLFAEDGIDVDKLIELVSMLTAHYRQDAIAVVTGSTLVEAEAPAPLPAPVSARRHVANRPALIPA